MSHSCHAKKASDSSQIYQIRLEGHLPSQWSLWFDGLSIHLEDTGDTLLTGPVLDQSALHGLLKKIRDVGMPLLALQRIDPPCQGERTTSLT